jgi:hypothetical protein
MTTGIASVFGVPVDIQRPDTESFLEEEKDQARAGAADIDVGVAQTNYPRSAELGTAFASIAGAVAAVDSMADVQQTLRAFDSLVRQQSQVLGSPASAVPSATDHAVIAAVQAVQVISQVHDAPTTEAALRASMRFLDNIGTLAGAVSEALGNAAPLLGAPIALFTQSITEVIGAIGVVIADITGMDVPPPDTGLGLPGSTYPAGPLGPT